MQIVRYAIHTTLVRYANSPLSHLVSCNSKMRNIKCLEKYHTHDTWPFIFTKKEQKTHKPKGEKENENNEEERINEEKDLINIFSNNGIPQGSKESKLHFFILDLYQVKETRNSLWSAHFLLQLVQIINLLLLHKKMAGGIHDCKCTQQLTHTWFYMLQCAISVVNNHEANELEFTI